MNIYGFTGLLNPYMGSRMIEMKDDFSFKVQITPKARFGVELIRVREDADPIGVVILLEVPEKLDAYWEGDCEADAKEVLQALIRRVPNSPYQDPDSVHHFVKALEELVKIYQLESR